ncbi:putative transcriptional regulator [Salinarchaeum sp. Harcht-Bsk1]|uniref:ArsR/SmtB family transcription factor n=1 Tax=Salinarchaeum sp. Harcht-Bsk1 TaxID=1333523 RepID=UPI00034248B3|nr:helix-turn-helix domain-containing protein [Salinarchaeum sp. Harcht-Bsk1]AGN00796.1 putative transcriptional regulator [Salinarchaeum sp. Harcht-Bsk1]
MKDLAQLQAPVEADHGPPRVLDLTGERADEVFSALSSATARTILSALYEEPKPASQLVGETDTSLQNVQYHLDRMQDAELIEVADTRYSEKGNEMCVYAPTDAAVVLCGSEQSATDRLRDAAPRLLGAVGVLGGASLGVQFLWTEYVVATGSSGGSAEQPMTMDTTSTAASSAGSETPLLAEPGVVFFLGCLAALLLVGIALLARRRYADRQSGSDRPATTAR